MAYVDPITKNTYPSKDWMMANINNLPEVKAAYGTKSTQGIGSTISTTPQVKTDIILYDPNTGRKLNTGESVVSKETGKTLTQGTAFQLPGSDISVKDIKTGVPEITTPITPVKEPTNANAINDYIMSEQKRIASEKEKAITSMSGDTTKSNIENLITTAQERPTIDTASLLKSQLETSGANALQSQVAQQNTKVATIKGELEKLDIAEQNEIDKEAGRLTSMESYDARKGEIQRKYNSQKAIKNAEYSAEAAVLSALQGNYNMAKSSAQDAVSAYTYDYQQNVKTFDTIFSIYGDWISDLDTEEKNILKFAATNAQDELDKVTKEKTDVSKLMIDYPNAGITLNDSIDEANNKATQYQIDNPKVNTQVIGSDEKGYQLINQDTGEIIKTIRAGTGTSTSNIFSAVTQSDIDEGLNAEINSGADALQAAKLYIDGQTTTFTEKEKTAIFDRAKEIIKNIEDAKKSNIIQDPNNPNASILKGYNPFITGLSNALFAK